MDVSDSFSRGKAEAVSIAKIYAWSCASTPTYVFMALCLTKHRDNFTFTRHLVLLMFKSRRIQLERHVSRTGDKKTYTIIIVIEQDNHQV
jgi:hypothetical protein